MSEKVERKRRRIDTLILHPADEKDFMSERHYMRDDVIKAFNVPPGELNVPIQAEASERMTVQPPARCSTITVDELNRAGRTRRLSANHEQPIRLRVEQAPYFMSDDYDLGIYLRREDGRVDVIRNLVMYTLEEGEGISPTMPAGIRLTRETLQGVMNDLWLLGFRPAESLRGDYAGTERALREEITYLRGLVDSLTNRPNRT